MSSQIALASSVPSDMADIPETPGMSLDYAKNGIVRIQAGTVKESGIFDIKTICSGFIASDADGNIFVVTTAHSVDYSENGLIRVVVKNDTTVDANLQSVNREKDFCILAVENKFNDKNSIPMRVPAYDDEETTLSAGDSVSALGFVKTGSSTEFSADDVNVQSGTLVKTADNNSGYIIHDIGISEEMDGGVLVDDQGYAIGLINTKEDGALDITEVDTLLDKENLIHRTKDKDLMYGELYDLCAGAKDFYKQSKGDTKEEILRVRNNALEVLNDEGPYNREALSTALSDYRRVVDDAELKTPKALVMIIALGITILILTFRLFRLIRRNKDLRNGHGMPATRQVAYTPKQASSAPKTAKAANVSKSGKMSGHTHNARLMMLKNGAMYELTGNRFTIGRSEGCDLVISGNNRVGRNHAYIECRSGAFYIVDKGSKNGTFINNMQADSNGIRLVSGDIIRLPGEEIQFIQE